MKTSVLSSMAALALALGVGPVLAQAKVDFGKREFDSKCASCHGVSAKGDGVLRPFLTKSPPDLTILAKANQGVFPMNRLYESIEGGKVPSHGTRDMPVWGQEYRVDAAAYYVDVPYDAAAFVRLRILALLEYLNRLQAR